ncbi:hypothetical protein SDC9_191700 [bioreactor metagenome]|uniref:Uncharacterized protein n=1 Tax=bioreactor metagenome TaxID=1076179 RepID=A0A645I120_9ZZZZ
MAPALPDHVILYLQIAVNEIGPIGIVGHNPPHMCRRQEHILRLLLLEETRHGRSIHQIQLPVRPSHQVGISLLFQVVPDGRPYQTPVAGNINFSIFLHSDYLLQ